MYIKHLSIKNYRNFKDFEIDLKPFTLIIGENNIGKTNLLNAIGIIFSQDITFFKKRMLEIDDINYYAVKQFKEAASNWNGKDETLPKFPDVIIEVTMTGFADNADQEAVVADWFIDKDLKDARLTYRFGYRGEVKQFVNENKGKEAENIDFPIDKCDYTVYGGLDQTKQVDFYFLRMLKMEFLDALRDAKKELVASGDYRLLYKILNKRDKDGFQDIKDKLKELNDLIKGDESKSKPEHKELSAVKEQIASFLKKISLRHDEDKNKVAFHFLSLEYSEILKKLSLVYGDNPISIERNGMGRNNLLYIALILSQLNSIEGKPEEKNPGNNKIDKNTFFNVVCVEEPEAHLHPHLQVHLARNIQNEVKENDEMQILLTSHSAHITSQLDLDNTVVLFYNDKTKDIKSHYILSGLENADEKEDAESKKHIRYLSRYLDATKSTLLFGRKMLLVEGISEQILIPYFFEIYTEKLKTVGKRKTLEQIGCTIVNVNSVAFSHFLELAKNSKSEKENFYVRSLVLTDQDTHVKDKNGDLLERAKKLKNKYDDKLSICVEYTKDDTFEKDLIFFNSKEKGKEIILNALCNTRRDNGDKLKANIGTSDITNIPELYNEIEDYKAEFATNLVETLVKEDNYKDFSLPEYIEFGFAFLLNSTAQNSLDEKAKD